MCLVYHSGNITIITLLVSYKILYFFYQGTDFCSTAGFDTLVKRLKEGKQMIVDVEDYLEKR